MSLVVRTRETGDGVAEVAVEGELDLSTAGELREALAGLLDRGVTRLVVNFEALSYLDSTGLGVLLGSLRRQRSRGGALQVICPPRHRRLFEITGLTKVIDLQDTESEDEEPLSCDVPVP
jgi:anti-sigma B factor antagonist